MQVTGTWLDAKDPQSNAQALLTGTVWAEQLSLRWLAGLEPQVVTLRAYAAAEELMVSLTDDQLISLESTRGLMTPDRRPTALLAVTVVAEFASTSACPSLACSSRSSAGAACCSR
ncbi:hypothetical protein [Micromonospora schwarzwaldensis]|uniref:hypothetical protein n=1 Tax=Micromonospora sp. DSM 45708 TaxID=3111767 RepID=UPI0031D47250